MAKRKPKPRVPESQRKHPRPPDENGKRPKTPKRTKDKK